MTQHWTHRGQLVVVAALGALAALALSRPAHSQQTPSLIRGGGSAGVARESVRFTSVGGKALKADFDRNVLKVPSSFGEPFAVTPGRRSEVVVWYRARSGQVRNVILSDDRSLFRIEPEAGR